LHKARILIYTESADARRGGLERAVCQLCHALIAEGFEVHLGADTAEGTPSQAHLHRLASTGYYSLAKETHRVRQFEAIRREVNPHVTHAVLPCLEADVYQPHGGLIPEIVERNVAMAGGAYGRWLKRKTSLVNRKRRYRAHLESRLLGRGSKTIVAAISAYVADQCRRHYGLADDRVRTIFNGVHVPQLTDEQQQQYRHDVRVESEITPEAPVGVFIAHQFRLKGLEWLIRAVAMHRSQLQAAQLRILVVGRDKSRRYLRLAAQLQCDRMFSFVGQVPETLRYYCAADFLVLPSFYDPCSLVTVEAVSCQLPCITTRFNGASELLEHGRSGFVLDDPTDTQQLGRYILTCCDADERQRIRGELAPLAPRIAFDRYLREMIQLYREIIEHKGT